MIPYRQAYWTPPANLRKAKHEAKEALRFIDVLVPKLEDEKTNQALWDAFGSQFSDFSYPLTRILDHGYLEGFNSAHDVSDQWSQLVRYLAVDSQLETIEKARQFLQHFADDLKPVYNWDTDTEIQVSIDEPLSEEAIQAAADRADDDEEGINFRRDVVPVWNAAVELPKHLRALEQYLKAVDYQAKMAAKKWGYEGRDDPRPDVENTEVVWHATTNLPAILKEGFKTREELGEAAGLGGAVEGISFTGSKEMAEQIAQAMTDAARLLQGPLTLERAQQYNESLGVATDELASTFPDIRNLLEHDELTPAEMFNWFRMSLMEADRNGTRFDPLFFDDSDLVRMFSSLDPENVGVVEATIDTTDDNITYLRAMEEWRVPVKSILSYGPEGSQTNQKQGRTMQRKAAFDSSTQGLIDEVLTLLNNTNQILMAIDSTVLEIQEAKAEGEPVSGAANSVVQLLTATQQHYEKAFEMIAAKLPGIAGGASREE